MISKQRGVIDPWTLGFLISLTGLTITQPWDNENEKISKAHFNELETIVATDNQPKVKLNFR